MSIFLEIFQREYLRTPELSICALMGYLLYCRPRTAGVEINQYRGSYRRGDGALSDFPEFLLQNYILLQNGMDGFLCKEGRRGRGWGWGGRTIRGRTTTVGACAAEQKTTTKISRKVHAFDSSCSRVHPKRR